MKAIFVDDEVLQHQTIRGLLAGIDRPLEMQFFRGPEEFLFALDDHLDVDVLFLDVEMPGMNGLDLAKHVRRSLPEVPIIFLTAYAEYAIKGYEVQAIDYLLKPITKERLDAALKKVLAIAPKKDEYLLIQNHRLRLADVLYIEAQGHRCVIVGRDQTIELIQSLAELTKLLPDSFIPTHRSFLVNLDHIYQVNKDHVVLESSRMVPLSRRLAKGVLAAFVAHYQREEYSL